MTQTDTIAFNIWDDYYDDGYVPKGEIQETYGYVEDYDIEEDTREDIANFVYEYIQSNVELPGVKLKLSGTDVEFFHLTHMAREKLLETLQNSKLSYRHSDWEQARFIDFYSES